MISYDQRYIAPLQPFSTKLHDAFLGAKQRFHGDGTEGANRPGADHFKLAVKKLAADFHFVRLRRSIFRRAALDHVAYVDILALDGNADRKSTRLNSSHTVISYAVFCLKKKQ